jgi:type II secretory pathway component PulF
MPEFQYKAYDSAGQLVSGLVESDSQALAMLALRGRSLHPKEIHLSRGEKAKGGAGFSWSKRVTNVEMALFLRQLATLVSSDVPLVQSLLLLERQATNPALREVVHAVCQDVQGGVEFSKALAKWPKVFPPLVISMARVGETGGVLGVILEELAGITERDQQIRTEVRTAMIYPVIVVVFGVLVVAILMGYVVPKLTAAFDDMGVELPLLTRVLLDISEIVKSYWWAALAAVAGVFAAGRAWRATDEGRLQSDMAMLKAPVLGTLLRKSSVARFSRALGVLLHGGVPMLEGLGVVKGVLGNAALGASIDRAASGLTEGDSLARQLSKEPLFPEMVTHMIGVGENSGELDRMLVRIAETYEFQTQQAAKVLMAIITPVMIVSLAVIVAFIALALTLPIFSMSQLI